MSLDASCFIYPDDILCSVRERGKSIFNIQSDTKKRELLKKPKTLKKSKKKKLLTEIEPLQIAF